MVIEEFIKVTPIIFTVPLGVIHDSPTRQCNNLIFINYYEIKFNSLPIPSVSSTYKWWPTLCFLAITPTGRLYIVKIRGPRTSDTAFWIDILWNRSAQISQNKSRTLPDKSNLFSQSNQKKPSWSALSNAADKSWRTNTTVLLWS